MSGRSAQTADWPRNEMPDANQTSYRDQVVEIHNLAVTSQVISGKDFSNCKIIGPAFILAQNDTTFSNCSFESPDVLISLDSLGVDRVFGVIVVSGCIFAGCRFEKVNLLVPGDVIEGFRDQLADGQPD